MNWMNAFMTVAILVGVAGIVNFAALVDHPKDIGIKLNDVNFELSETIKIGNREV